MGILKEEGGIKIAAKDRFFLNGTPKSFELVFPSILATIIDRATFLQSLGEINEAISSRWPCRLCVAFAIILVPFTLGLSLIPLHIVTKKTVEAAANVIEELNRTVLRVAGITLRLRTSWIEVDFIENSKTDSFFGKEKQD
eukprot:TRINITY_DN4902_c0_g1_i3.p2 TRINITY_DN4902_c0_g1~~TRINITY_DN4902_c0_g1_i3.p2  ORF type:complete len:141 (+),score=21.33 TRINITY_DN4902_c0_g1_i3:99-521(+)